MVSKSSHGQRTVEGIIATALAIWRETGTPGTARQIGQRMGLRGGHSAVLYHFRSVDALKTAVAHEAVRLGDPVIVPQLIVWKHPAASVLSADDRARYLTGC